MSLRTSLSIARAWDATGRAEFPLGEERGGQAVGSQRLLASFHLFNAGASPVAILSAHASCGCAVLRVDRRRVEPGRAALLEVGVDPIEIGKRLVSLTVETDSRVTPQIIAGLTILGSRRPPYLQEATGDLYYHPGRQISDERTLTVKTIEAGGSPTVQPPIHCDLPFVLIEKAAMSTRRDPDDPTIVERRYEFRVRFRSRPPRNAFSGTVRVVDPWFPERKLEVHIQGAEDPEMAVAPKQLRLSADSRGNLTGPARLSIRLRDQIDGCPGPEASTDGPLMVEWDPGDEWGRLGTLVVRQKPGCALTRDRYTIHLEVSGSEGRHRVDVPVIVSRDR